MILPDLILPSRQNQIWSESGIDSLENCFDKKHFKLYPYPVEYRYNTRGFRDAEWPANLQDAIWCFGDSFTVGIGSPATHSWPSILEQKIGQRTINVSMDGASNNWIARRSIDVIQSIRPKALVIHWSYIERREQPNKYLDQAWSQFYAGIRDTQWPEEIKLENFNTLPQHIQNEILTGTEQGWRCGLSDEQLRLPYIKSTDEEDVENTINCIESVNLAAGTIKVIHSFIPQFINKSYKQLFDSQLDKTSNRLIIPEFKPVDFARDGHHYDIKTATRFVESLVPLLVDPL